MAKYSHDEFIKIMNKIAYRNKIQNTIDTTVKTCAEKIQDDALFYMSDMIDSFQEYYLEDLTRSLDKMYDCDNMITRYVFEVLYSIQDKSIFCFGDKVYELTKDPETIWQLIEEVYLNG